MKIKKGMIVGFTPYNESWKEIHIDKEEYDIQLKGKRLKVVGFETIDGVKFPLVQPPSLSGYRLYVRPEYLITDFSIKSNKPAWF